MNRFYIKPLKRWLIIMERYQNGLTANQNKIGKPYAGNRCYNIPFAFCDELKAYVTGFVRSGNTYTANGAAELIKEIVATLKAGDLEILFRMDSGYFDEEIIKTIESLGCKYLIKAKAYTTLVSQVTASSVLFIKGAEGKAITELFIKPNKWDEERRFVVSRVLNRKKKACNYHF